MPKETPATLTATIIGSKANRTVKSVMMANCLKMSSFLAQPGKWLPSDVVVSAAASPKPFLNAQGLEDFLEAVPALSGPFFHVGLEHPVTVLNRLEN